MATPKLTLTGRLYLRRQARVGGRIEHGPGVDRLPMFKRLLADGFLRVEGSFVVLTEAGRQAVGPLSVREQLESLQHQIAHLANSPDGEALLSPHTASLLAAQELLRKVVDELRSQEP